MSLFLGVDGGGTKTRFVLVDGEDGLVASCEGPSSYHIEIGMEGLRSVLANGLGALFGQAAIEASAVAYAFFGLPAYGEDSTAQSVLDAMPQPLLGHNRYRCGNDMVCAWAGSLAGEDGINVVAGTGSIAYGERKGRAARAGGWSEVFSDEGSAYWIAVQGLNIFTRMSDGRLPRGPLYAAVRAALDLVSDLDLSTKLPNARARERIAALSQLVARAARQGDPSAIEIFDHAARELVCIVDAVRRALGFPAGESIPLSYSGGVFNAGDLILRPFRRHIEARSARYDLRAPVLAPSLGAALYAARLAGVSLSPAAIKRLAACDCDILPTSTPEDE
jgi:N-acetylglucosamine kinase-like BadF-type ATPase